jgi:hypothetical protein
MPPDLSGLPLLSHAHMNAHCRRHCTLEPRSAGTSHCRVVHQVVRAVAIAEACENFDTSRVFQLAVATIRITIDLVY